MLRPVAAALFLMCMAAPLWAAETEPFNPDQPFEEALSTTLLRSLLDQALDTLEDHVEITGRLSPDSSQDGKDKHLRFKFYPEGKSKSDQHLTAEGWFRSSPETGQRDWHFRFKLPETAHRNSRYSLNLRCDRAKNGPIIVSPVTFA